MDHVNIASVFDGGTTEIGRPYFVMELVQGVPDHQVLRRQPPDAAGAAGVVRAGLPGDPARPSEGHHPPRHQAVQCHGHTLRRQAGAQGDRLRRGQGDRAEADRADPVHAVRHHGRHAGIHEPGAGGDERLGRRYPQRHLFAGCAALRTADGQHAIDAQANEGSGVWRDSTHDQGGGTAQAEHAALRLGRGAGVDLGQSPHGAGQADEADARRAGLDCDEMPGEGPQPPLRDCQRLRGRRAALPGR